MLKSTYNIKPNKQKICILIRAIAKAKRARALESISDMQISVALAGNLIPFFFSYYFTLLFFDLM